MSFNGRIGHNGERLKDSWFWKKDISGGGTLLDNGCHLLDLSRLFVGNFVSGKGASNSYWKNIEVEDTASGILKLKMEKQLLFIARGDYFRVISFSKSMDLMDTLMSMGDLIHTEVIKYIGQTTKIKNYCPKTLVTLSLTPIF